MLDREINRVETESEQNHNHNHDDDHDHSHISASSIFIRGGISFVFLIVSLLLEYLFTPRWLGESGKLLLYASAYIPVALPVIKEAINSFVAKEYFSEFLLMSIATLGAFAIGEYPEAVAVMLFYTVGEGFQTLALNRARSNIKSLIDERPSYVTLLQGDNRVKILAKEVKVGQKIELKPGEKVALDGILSSNEALFDTSSLTGESVPNTIRAGGRVLAGMINLNRVAVVEVSTPYNKSKLSEILEMIEQASQRKAPTELFIKKFARYYTPFVIFSAVAIVLIPALVTSNYSFSDWFYRALIFLVISCPCALVISIPLGYFGGIGAASKRGVLFKGGNFLDSMATIEHVAFDKTGTLTKGVFTITKVELKEEINGTDGKQLIEEQLLVMIKSIEQFSTHPIAQAIASSLSGSEGSVKIEGFEEIAGEGVKGVIDSAEMVVGNLKLMNRFGFNPAPLIHEGSETPIYIAFNGQEVGYITVADQIKEEAHSAVAKLNSLGVKTTLLSGDKNSVVESVARQVGIRSGYGELLPQDKVRKIEEIKKSGERVAFVGDGVNDAPVIALSDVGIAMGGLGSDAAVEIADVVIQDDRISKVVTAIEIGRATKRVVWQNIILAFGVKIAVLALGAGGIATMWEAVFADVGVALLAILNAMKIQRVRYTQH